MAGALCLDMAGALCLDMAGALCLDMAGALCLDMAGALCLDMAGALCLDMAGALCLDMAGAIGTLRSAITVLWSDKPSATVGVCNVFTRGASYQDVEPKVMYVCWEIDMLFCVKLYH